MQKKGTLVLSIVVIFAFVSVCSQIAYGNQGDDNQRDGGDDQKDGEDNQKDACKCFRKMNCEMDDDVKKQAEECFTLNLNNNTDMDKAFDWLETDCKYKEAKDFRGDNAGLRKNYCEEQTEDDQQDICNNFVQKCSKHMNDICKEAQNKDDKECDEQKECDRFNGMVSAFSDMMDKYC